MKEVTNMQNENKSGNMNACKVTEKIDRRSISFFWLVIGGLLLFVGIASILHTAGILTERGAEYAEDSLWVLIGAILVGYAVKAQC